MKTMDARITPATAMAGTMMDVDLTVTWLFEHIMRNHGRIECVTRVDDGSIHRYTYADMGKRVAQLAHALVEMGVKPGDRVATFGWNTYRHLELYYAVPMIGAVLHTTNIRLFPDQVCWVFEHAGDSVIFVDSSLAATVEAATAMRPDARREFVVMGESDALPRAKRYEALLAGKPETYDWPQIDEKTASMLCYTSATTGDPKGVAFTHRSTVLHAMAAGMADAIGIRQRDVVMPVVPMFHVGAWGLPYLAPMVGAKLVLPGSKLDPGSLIELIEKERVTFSAGVPTVWLAVRDMLVAQDKRVPSLEHLLCGGSAIPPSLFDDFEARGVRMIHAWGATEMSPIGTTGSLVSDLVDSDWDEQRTALLTQGRFAPIVAWKIVDDEGREVPRDGKTPGAVLVRGQAVTSGYYKSAVANTSVSEGWYSTGDIGTIDEYGYLRLVDRSKDLVKSGGEWISSVDLENTIMGHPAVREAAVIGLPHPKWVERPVAVVALRDGREVAEDDLRAWIGERVAKWMIPDRVIFVDAIPRTGVGKFLKRELRAKYQGLLEPS